MPTVWLALDLYSCCVGQFGSIGKSTILVFYFGKGKKQLCAGHMTSTWPRWLPCKSHLEKSKFTIFWSSAFSVHFRSSLYSIVPVTFKITCQSSQGHLLSKRSIDFLRHCSHLLGKVKGKVFSAN